MARRAQRKVSGYEQMAPNTAGGLHNMMQTVPRVKRQRKATKLAREFNLDSYGAPAPAPAPLMENVGAAKLGQLVARVVGALALSLPIFLFLLLTGPRH